MQNDIERLIEEIQAETLETRDWTGISAIAPEVIDALRRTPRRDFVPEELSPQAYANRPLPLGFGQTISQPYIVALMTQLLLPQADHIVLEVGTGSGYQAAVLARLVRRVVSIEIIAALADSAAERLRALGLDNVETHHGDGHHGWAQCAPYDGIMVTACSVDVPPPLLAQLKPGGRMAIPVGPAYGYQELRLVEKSSGGDVTSRAVLPVAFVPLTRSGPAPDRISAE